MLARAENNPGNKLSTSRVNSARLEPLSAAESR